MNIWEIITVAFLIFGIISFIKQHFIDEEKVRFHVFASFIIAVLSFFFSLNTDSPPNPPPTTTEPPVITTTEPPVITTTEPLVITTTEPITQTNKIVTFYENNSFFQGNFTSKNRNNSGYISLTMKKTGYYTFDFSYISNENNIYRLTIIDDTNQEISSVPSSKQSFEVYLEKGRKYTFIFKVTTFENDFSFTIKMFLPNN